MVNKNLDKIFSDIKQPQIKDNFEKWNLFLNNEVDFWLKTSEKHTKEHCSRVLLFCLLIADKQGLSQKETDILCMAAVFHDSRRTTGMMWGMGKGRRIIMGNTAQLMSWHLSRCVMKLCIIMTVMTRLE